MPGVTEDWLRAALRCPICGGGLRWEAAPACGRAGCPGAAGFAMAAGQPVLIDAARSVIDPAGLAADGGASPVRRGARWRRRVRRLAFGENAVAGAHARRLLALLRDGAGARAPVVLIVGGGETGVGEDSLLAAPDIETVCFDIYASDRTRFVADGHAIPLAAGSVDAVWIQAVLEHVLEPAIVAAEIRRVLRPEGLVYAETPFMQQVHEGAYDFTRFTESGHRWLFREFECLASGPVAGLGTALIWSVRYLMTGLTRSRAWGEALTLPFFWLRFADRLTGAAEAADGASGVYFLGRVAAQPIAPRDAIAFYRRRRD